MPDLFKIMFLLPLFFLGVSCDDSSEQTTEGDPSNLQMMVEITEEGSRDVEVTATGDNVIEYEFDLGDNSELVVNTSGLLSHTYEREGNYEIEVKAYGASGRFVRASEFVEIGEESDEIDDTGYSTPLTYDGWSRIWNDEFDAAELNESYWNYELGTGSNGWGNNELQHYRRENTSLDQGYLIIEAKRESFSGSQYTSSRLTTEGKFDFKYGRVDIRAKLPRGQGIWPALWMLGANFRSVGWPYCGEIDVMEMIGGEGKDNVVHGTIHWDNNGTKADYGGSEQLSSGIFYDEFHVFSIIWDSDAITWYLDDEQFHTVSITPAALSEFQEEFFFIFNVAVGGNWPGSPNSSTNFPQRMIVDYVRVFQTE